MSERVYLPNDKALGLDMPTMKYDSRRGQEGYVEVSDNDAQLLRAYTGLKVGQQHFAPAAPERTCSKCAFRQYAALAPDVCSRCGSDWEPDSSIGADNPTPGKRVKTYDI